jgi:hypothetical protein
MVVGILSRIEECENRERDGFHNIPTSQKSVWIAAYHKIPHKFCLS